MLDLPQSGPGEGVHEGDPIKLSGLTAVEFEWLVKWMTGDSKYVRFFQLPCARHLTYCSGDAKFSVEGLLAILRLSHFYDIHEARRFALSALEYDRYFTLQSSMRLDAAVKYNIRLWFKPAVRELLSVPLTTLRPRDVSRLSGPLLVDLIRHRRDIELKRAVTLNTKYLFVRGAGCPSPERCPAVWERMWDNFRDHYNSELHWELPLKGIHDTITDLVN